MNVDRVGVPFDSGLSGCDRCFSLSRVLVPVAGGTLAGGSRVGLWCKRCVQEDAGSNRDNVTRF